MSAPDRPFDEIKAMAAFGWILDDDGDYVIPSQHGGSPASYFLAPYFDEFQSAIAFRQNNRWAYFYGSWGESLPSFETPIAGAVWYQLANANS